MFQLRTDFNLLLINLTVCELLVAGLGIPVDAVAAAQLGWKMGQIVCWITGFMLTFLGQGNEDILKKPVSVFLSMMNESDYVLGF